MKKSIIFSLIITIAVAIIGCFPQSGEYGSKKDLDKLKPYGYQSSGDYVTDAANAAEVKALLKDKRRKDLEREGFINEKGWVKGLVRNDDKLNRKLTFIIEGANGYMFRRAIQLAANDELVVFLSPELDYRVAIQFGGQTLDIVNIHPTLKNKDLDNLAIINNEPYIWGVTYQTPGWFGN